jgi:leader peptidase (prepilin peptidase) / N-methyltransferase
MAFLYLLVALIGILAGGVVNALADDLPHRRNPRLPHYPDDTPRPPIAWLGLTAFLFGKRVSPNGAKLSWRYPLTELLTSGLMVLTLYASDERQASTLQIIFWLIYMAILVLITVIDIEHRLILFKVINPTVVLVIIEALLTSENAPPTLVNALIGGAAGYIIFFILFNGGAVFTYIMGKLRGQDIPEVAFGYGDVMLAGVSGLMLGWQPLIFSLFITVFLGAFGALIYIISRRFLGKRYSAFSAIPYGPYIVIGTLLMLLFPSQVGQYLFGAIY